MGIMFAYMSVHHMYAMSEEARESIGSAGIGVMDRC